jgi:hypothetical protein
MLEFERNVEKAALRTFREAILVVLRAWWGGRISQDVRDIYQLGITGGAL